MPQPLSRFAPSAFYRIASGGGGQRIASQVPDIALLAAEGIASWATVESRFLQLYVALLGGPQERATVAYLALETQSAKVSVINAIARVALSEDEQKLLQSMLRISKTNQKTRDKIAHWSWGYIPSRPDCLLLADPRALVDIVDTRKIFVFLAEDFEELISSNDRLCYFLHRFWRCFVGLGRREHIYAELSAEPEIRRRLDP